MILLVRFLLVRYILGCCDTLKEHQQTNPSLITVLTERNRLTLCNRTKQAYANITGSLLIRENVKCLIIHKATLLCTVNCTQPKKKNQVRSIELLHTHLGARLKSSCYF